MSVSGGSFCEVREIMWWALGCSCACLQCIVVCVLCMCELCVCVGGTRGFRVVSKCCKGVDGLLCVVCISARVVAVWENALERPCVLVRVCGVHACANMGDCEVARENRRFHKTRISHLIGATAGTDGTCQLSAFSISLSTRYDVTSVETHDVGGQVCRRCNN